MATAPFDHTSIVDLTERTAYEAWLLEAVYKIAEQPIASSADDSLIYPPDGNNAKVIFNASMHLVLGDWRPRFLNVGAPLILVTSFKLLDMIMEWVLAQNGVTPAFQFSKKISALRGPIVFPPLVESRPWLRERLIALYEELDPLRGTIIHDRHFQATEGSLQVSSSRRGNIGPVVTFSPNDLRNLSVVFVSLLRFIEGIWTMDVLQEKRIRHTLDELIHLHRQPSLGQLPPRLLTVRLYAVDDDLIEIDLDKIRRDITKTFPSKDTLFEIRVVVVNRSGTNASAYLINWEQLQNAGSCFQTTTANLANAIVPVPDDVDPIAVARDLRPLPREA